ncbi:MAG: GNAT family N-acetyltransferase [Planctomycetes bacterium]|nr:GNAT family N-acetyltransferase [Planctomycetota bacterium]
MDINGQRKISAILKVLAGAGGPMGSSKIAEGLQMLGVDLKERMVRYYLGEMDKGGLTRNLGRAGREITEQGRKELETAVAIDKVGFVSARVDELAYRMSFDLSRGLGTVILNVSRIPVPAFSRTRELVNTVLRAGLGMGRFVALGREGDDLAGHPVPRGQIAIGTVCSVTLNGALRQAGVPTISRFGGLLELCDGKPLRFTQIIYYEWTTLDPVEIFIKGKMTQVLAAAETGAGTIGASFREVPATSLPAVKQAVERLERVGLGGVLLVGRPGRPLLDIPVSQGRAGLIVAAGLNPLAAIEEDGIDTENHPRVRQPHPHRRTRGPSTNRLTRPYGRSIVALLWESSCSRNLSMKDDIAINVSGAAVQFLNRNLAEKVEVARVFGLNSIELHPYKEWESFFDLPGAELRRIKETAEALDRISVHAPMGDTFTILDDEKAQEAMDGDCDSIRAAGFLGAETVVIHVRMKYVESDGHKRRAADFIRDLGEYGQCFGVTIAVETSTDLRAPEDLADIIRYTNHPNVGVTIDTGHLLNCLSDADKKAEDVAVRYNAMLHKTLDLFLAEKKVYHIHLNDIRAGKLWDHYGMGLGFVDFDGTIEKLLGSGYRGILAMEIHRGDGDEVSSITAEEIQAATDFTKMLVAKHRSARGTDVPVRPAREADLAEISEIVRDIWDIGFEYNFEQRFGRIDETVWHERTVPTILGSLRGHLEEVVVAKVNGDVAGFMAHRAPGQGRKIGSIGYNGVARKYRGRGIGAALLRRSLDILREKGMTHVKVGTGLNEGHRAARRMYERAGFEPVMESITYAMKL